MDPENRQKDRFQFFCPLCGHHQKTKTSHKIGLRHHLQFALATFVFCYFTWFIFGPKGVLTYLVFWGLTDFVMRFQRRSQWLCDECGFDPFLYKRDPELMRKAVRDYIQTKIDKDEKFADIKFRNYRSRVGSEENTQDAVNKGGENSASSDAHSTPDVDNDFKLVDTTAGIADVHRTETP